jgi:hypothetical protein
MEAIFSSETSVDFQQIARRYIPEDSTLHNHRCDNLKLSFFIFVLLFPSISFPPFLLSMK